MKTQLLSSLFFLAVPFFNYAQQTFEIDFGDAGKKQVQLSDDADNLPTYEMGISPICFMGMPGILFAYKLNPIYRLSDKLWFDIDFKSSYAKSSDFNNIPDEIYKPTLNLEGLAHYSIFNFKSTKNVSTPIDYVYDNSEYIKVFTASLPRTISNHVFADFGGGYFNHHSSYKYFDAENSRSFIGGNVSSIYLQFGATYRRSKSWKVKTEGNSRSYYRYGELHLNFTYGLANQFPIYETIGSGSSPETYTYIEANSGVEDLIYKSFGWKFGYDHTFGIKGKGLAMVLGFEVGFLPSYTNGGSGEFNTSGGALVAFNWGINIGENPWK